MGDPVWDNLEVKSLRKELDQMKKARDALAAALKEVRSPYGGPPSSVAKYIEGILDAHAPGWRGK